MGIFSFTCPNCNGKTQALGEPTARGRKVICAACRTPMVSAFTQRCPGCNYRYFHWAQGEEPGTLYLSCARCGRNLSDRDNWRLVKMLALSLALAIPFVLADRFLVKSLLPEPTFWRPILRVALNVGALVPLWFLLLRRLPYWPDWLVGGGAVGPASAGRRAVWDRLVQVRAIEEEYRFIQFNPFPCACENRTERKVESHGVTVRPRMLLSLGRLLPIFRLVDLVRVICPVCGGSHTYTFDVGGLPHIQRGFRRRFTQNPMKLIENHMALVADLQRRYEREGLDGFRF